MATLDEIAKELKALHKDVRKIRQHLEDPTGEKKEARSKNNGFKKPLNVSPELRAFLNLGTDEKISRSDVTNRINIYVTEKGLKAGQNISLDDTLKRLLIVPEGTQVTFLNIQKFINPHYIKDVPAATVKPEAVPAAAPKKVRPKVVKN